MSRAEDEKYLEAIALVEAGLSVRAAALKCGVRRNTLAAILKELE